MKNLRYLLCAVAVILIFAGCASDSDPDYYSPEMSRLPTPEPPAFLNADFASLFGNASFSARVEVEHGMPGSRPPITGELSGRNGSLFFISDQQRGRRGFSGGLSALWDAPAHTAYLLNEPLQGYAPIRATPTNGPLEAVVVGEENVGSERCRKSIMSRKVGTESVPVLIAWRSLAEQDLPLRIQTTNTPGTVTLTLSRVRMQPPPTELFELPNGFKRYETTDAMIGELMHRRTEASGTRSRRRGTLPEEDENAHDVQHPTRPY